MTCDRHGHHQLAIRTSLHCRRQLNYVLRARTGLQAGDVLAGFGEESPPTGWALEKGQDFESRDVGGMEDFSWDSKGFCGGWWTEGMPPRGRVSRGGSALEASAR